MEFKKYLRGVGDVGTRLLFKFRSGTHGLNEGSCPLKSFLGVAGEGIDERESSKFEEGKVKRIGPLVK